MEAYRIEQLSFTYPLMEKKALNGVNLSIDSGEFVAICGKSGSGKSTLLRQLKTVLAPHGEKSGNIYFDGEALEELSERRQASEIGYVLQSPENQIVTDKVWHELAFGLESLGYDSDTIRLRVAEMASFFGIQTWFHKDVTDLSGGQKQILNLAGVMIMQPKVLVLDEPTSQLDPIAASDFLETIKKINRELGTTIIMSEHRLEEIIPISDRLVVMDEGFIIADGDPRAVGRKLSNMDHPMFHSMTTAMQIYDSAEDGYEFPITVNQGRKWLSGFVEGKKIKEDLFEEEQEEGSQNAVIKFKDVWFKYEKNLPDVIKDLSLEIKSGEIYCIVGGNGTGKTTALSLISGINKPYRGQITINGKDIKKMSSKELFKNNLGVLPQDPQHLFVKKTVELDLYEMFSGTKLSKDEKRERVEEIANVTEIEDVLFMHPYDLSGGEQQRAALAKVLLLEPKILLLDEPTKGLDSFFKEKFSQILNRLKEKGTTIVIVSHDIEFCARYGDRCAMFFDGTIITSNTTRVFFSGNSFYTTSANRIARGICSKIVTIEDVITLCKSVS